MVSWFVAFVALLSIRLLLRRIFWPGRPFRLLGGPLGFVVGLIVGKVVGPTRTCPHCGFPVNSLESSCPKCGYSPSLARLAGAMPATPVSSSAPAQATSTGSILPMGQCPNCEEIIPMSSQSCPFCRYKPDAQGSVPA